METELDREEREDPMEVTETCYPERVREPVDTVRRELWHQGGACGLQMLRWRLDRPDHPQPTRSERIIVRIPVRNGLTGGRQGRDPEEATRRTGWGVPPLALQACGLHAPTRANNPKPKSRKRQEGISEPGREV